MTSVRLRHGFTGKGANSTWPKLNAGCLEIRVSIKFGDTMMIRKHAFSAPMMMGVLILTNFINYVDRGIV